MKTFDFKFRIADTSRAGALTKMNALTKLASELDARTLQALADNGPDLFRNPATSPIIKSYLDLQ